MGKYTCQPIHWTPDDTLVISPLNYPYSRQAKCDFAIETDSVADILADEAWVEGVRSYLGERPLAHMLMLRVFSKPGEPERFVVRFTGARDLFYFQLHFAAKLKVRPTRYPVTQIDPQVVDLNDGAPWYPMRNVEELAEDVEVDDD